MNVLILKKIIKETKSNWRFIFEDPLYDKLDFIPGQLIQLCSKPGEPDSVIRNYSVASWPDGTNNLELIITYLEGGAMSEYLFKEAESNSGNSRLNKLIKIEMLASESVPYIPIWVDSQKAWSQISISRPIFNGSGIISLSDLEIINE